MTEGKNLSKHRLEVYQFLWLLISFSGEPSKFLFGYKVRTTIFVLVTTKENDCVLTELDASISALVFSVLFRFPLAMLC